MSSRRSSRRVAHVEECDEDGNVIGGPTYAESVASPTKEKMNTSKKKSRRGEASSSHINTDSDSTLHSTVHEKTKSRPSRESKDKNNDRAVATTNNKKSVSLASRPAVKQVKTSPAVSSSRSKRDSRGDDATFYGVQSSRPRAQTFAPRPESLHGRSRPPLSNIRYHTPGPAAPHPPPQSAVPIPLPPPPQSQHQWPLAAVSYPQPPVPLPPPAQPEYFTHQRHPTNLAARFGTTSRPQSAIGHRSTAAPVIGYHHEEYTADPVLDRGSLSRRPSLTRRSRHEEDRLRMPPPILLPQRPMSARPSLGIRSAGAFAPPSPFAPPPARTSGAFDDEDFEDRSPFQEVSPLTYEPPYRASRSRRPSIGATTIAYETAPPYSGALSYSTEVARGGGSRRSSFYGGQAVPKYEEQRRRASQYQTEVDGGSSVPLTAETLRRASRGRDGSSRSSGSHEDSDWKRSATTRTTQSASDEVTIQVLKGGTTFKVAGVPLECQDGAVFSMSTRGADRGDRDRGSDRSSYMGEEERRGRLERVPSGRARAPSQSASYSRGMGPGAYDYVGYSGSYGYPPPFPGFF